MSRKKSHRRVTLADRADQEHPTPRSAEQKILLIGYGPDRYEEHEIWEPSEVNKYLGKWPVIWINVDGFGDYTTIRKFAEILSLHPLAVEDAINPRQRAKVDDYDDTQYIVTRMVAYDSQLSSEQISIFLGTDVLFSISEQPGGDCFEPVRERIRKSRGPIRGEGPDYLAYALLDSAIDGYFPVLEQYGELLDTVEDEIIARPTTATIAKVHHIKRDLLAVRRAVWPLRDLINSLIRDENPLICSQTRLYFRDTYDHAVRLLDLVETYRELSADLMDVYLSSVSNRLNEVMKVLTIITTIFIPPTFIAGIYGMNFNTKASPYNMPELNWPYGYVIALTAMALLSLAMMAYMVRRGWLTWHELVAVSPSAKDIDEE